MSVTVTNEHLLSIDSKRFVNDEDGSAWFDTTNVSGPRMSMTRMFDPNIDPDNGGCHWTNVALHGVVSVTVEPYNNVGLTITVTNANGEVITIDTYNEKDPS